jgi:hypothetical protein
MHLKTTPTNEVELVREMLRATLFNLLYHEEELHKTHKVIACAKALLARGGYTFSLEEAAEQYDERDDNPESAEEWVKSVVAETMRSVQFHEEHLLRAHSQLAAIKTMLLRGNYVEIDLEKITKEVEERHRKEG